MQEPQTQANALLDLPKQLQSVALSFKCSKTFPAWLLCLKVSGYREYDGHSAWITHCGVLQGLQGFSDLQGFSAAACKAHYAQAQRFLDLCDENGLLHGLGRSPGISKHAAARHLVGCARYSQFGLFLLLLATDHSPCLDFRIWLMVLS